MSIDPKRLFLGTKIIITDRWNQLRINTIKALECLKSWLGIISVVEDEIEDGRDVGGDDDVDVRGG